MNSCILKYPGEEILRVLRLFCQIWVNAPVVAKLSCFPYAAIEAGIIAKWLLSGLNFQSKSKFSLIRAFFYAVAAIAISNNTVYINVFFMCSSLRCEQFQAEIVRCISKEKDHEKE